MNRGLRWLRGQLHPLWRLRQWRAYRWLIQHADRPIPRRVGRVTAHAYLWRDWARVHPAAYGEPRMAGIFCALLTRWECDCFVDIGAHVGGYTWLTADARPHARLLLFEPDPRNQALLRRTIARSQLDRATMHPVALADTSGAEQFAFDDASGTTGSLLTGHAPSAILQSQYGSSTHQAVETRTLDSFLSELSRRRVILKIDVEGAEVRVLTGAARVLAEVRPAVFYESFDGKAGTLLARAGYEMYSLEENSNYLALPREHAALAGEFGLTAMTSRAT